MSDSLGTPPTQPDSYQAKPSGHRTSLVRFCCSLQTFAGPGNFPWKSGALDSLKSKDFPLFLGLEAQKEPRMASVILNFPRSSCQLFTVITILKGFSKLAATNKIISKESLLRSLRNSSSKQPILTNRTLRHRQSFWDSNPELRTLT